MKVILNIKEEVKHYPTKVNNSPLISVCITAYNHGAFIKDCLDSVLKQKTTFEFEILLGEDNSKDDTRKICKAYADKYPDKIKLFLHSRENLIKVNGRATGRFNYMYNMSHAKGKYLAPLDGDDYWTDEYKLQKQVDFLEANEDYGVCFHRVKVLKDGKFYERNLKVKETTTIENLIVQNYIKAVSCVVRHNKNEIVPSWLLYENPVADWAMALIAAQKGKIKLLNDSMAIYRKHEGGVFSLSMSKTDKMKSNILSRTNFIQLLGEDSKAGKINLARLKKQCLLLSISASLSREERRQFKLKYEEIKNKELNISESKIVKLLYYSFHVIPLWNIGIPINRLSRLNKSIKAALLGTQ